MQARTTHFPSYLMRLSNATQSRSFSSTQCALAKNRVFQTCRTPTELDDLIAMHTSRRRPLITLFTASWCRTCHEILPIVQSLIEHEYVGLDEGGVGFAEVQIDAPTADDLGQKYAITSLPTLLAFSKGEARESTRSTDASKMRDRKWLIQWIETESRNGGGGEKSGGFGFGSWFGGKMP